MNKRPFHIPVIGSGLWKSVFPLSPLFRGKGHRLAHLGGGLMQSLLHSSNVAPLGGEVKP